MHSMWFMRLPDKIHARMAAFSLVGVVNTAVGVCVILIARVLGAHAIVANIFGYGAGLIVSFTLNSRITFQKRSVNGYTVVRFLGAFGAAFLVNITVVWMVADVLRQHGLLASLAGVPLFTVVFYLLCEYWVFRRAHTNTPEQFF